jgi:hypothetical protein
MRGMILAVLAIGSVSAAGSSSAAERVYPYCTHSFDEIRCDFTSYDQCMATAFGLGLECVVNPIVLFQQSSQPDRPPPRRKRARRTGE